MAKTLLKVTADWWVASLMAGQAQQDKFTYFLSRRRSFCRVLLDLFSVNAIIPYPSLTKARQCMNLW